MAPQVTVLAVGEVHQAGGAEDQRQADRGDGDDQAEAHAVEELLRDLLERRGGVPLAVTQRDVQDPAAVRVDRDDVAALAGKPDVVAERVEVEGGGVTGPRRGR